MPTDPLRPPYVIPPLEVSRPINILGSDLNGVVLVRGQGLLKSETFVAGSTGWAIYADGSVEFNDGTFRGTLEAGEVHIPDTTTAASAHIDSDGDIWVGANVANKASAPFQVDSATGDVTINDGTLTGDLTLSGGVISTSSSAQRVVLDETLDLFSQTDWPSVQVYPAESVVLPGYLSVWTASGSDHRLALVAPESSTAGYQNPAELNLHSDGDASIGKSLSGSTLTVLSDYLDLFNQKLSFGATDDYINGSSSGIRCYVGGTQRLEITSAGYLEVQGRRVYFGNGSNDYILFNDTNDEYQFYIDAGEVFSIADNSGTATTGWAAQQVVINDPRTSGSGTPGLSMRSAVLNYAAILRLSSAAANRIVVRDSADTAYGELWGDLTDTSSARYKENIRNLADSEDDIALDLLDVLHPRRYRMNGQERFGFVSEEIGEHVREAAEWAKPEESDLLEGEDPDGLVALGYQPTAMNAVNYRLIQLMREEYQTQLRKLKSQIAALEAS